MIIYLLKVSTCVALFYAIYFVFFRTTNRHQMNRAYLLAGILLSFIVPLMVLPATPMDIVPAIIGDRLIAMDNPGVVEIKASIETSYTFIYYGYFAGVAICLLVTLIGVLKPVRLYMFSEKISLDNHTTIIHPGIHPFSFLGVLFIPSPHEDPIVIEHEMVHIRQRHWIDLVLVELASVILWFNPIIYFYKKSIAIQHEYIADREVTLNVPVETYLDSLVKHLESTIHSSLVNGFNTQSIKQRIIMVTNRKSYSALRYMIILPLVAGLVMAFSTKATKEHESQNKELRSPVDVSKLKSGEGVGFGKRLNPATNKEVIHTGVDFVLAAGNSVYATADGVVVSAETSKTYGKLIIIEHSNKLRTSSAHLERILVKSGDKVEAGQLIGIVGSTGLSTGPHLHFEVIKDGVQVDPVPYLDLR